MNTGHDELDAMIIRYLDGALDEASTVRLNELLENDPWAACRMAELALDHSELRRVFATEESAREGRKSNTQILKFIKLPFWRKPSAWAAAAVLLFIVSFTGYLLTGYRKETEVAAKDQPQEIVTDTEKPQRTVPAVSPAGKKDERNREAAPRSKKDDKKNIVALTGTISATLTKGNEVKIVSLKLSIPEGVDYDVVVDRVSSKLGHKYNGKSVSVTGIVGDVDGKKRLTVKSILDEPGDRENAKPKAPVNAQDEDK